MAVLEKGNWGRGINGTVSLRGNLKLTQMGKQAMLQTARAQTASQQCQQQSKPVKPKEQCVRENESENGVVRASDHKEGEGGRRNRERDTHTQRHTERERVREREREKERERER